VPQSRPITRATFRRSSGRIRQHVDDVGPSLAMSIAVAEQLSGDRISVGLVSDQEIAKVFSGCGTEVSRRERR
jgi:hypothetical protein